MRRWLSPHASPQIRAVLRGRRLRPRGEGVGPLKTENSVVTPVMGRGFRFHRFHLELRHPCCILLKSTIIVYLPRDRDFVSPGQTEARWIPGAPIINELRSRCWFSFPDKYRPDVKNGSNNTRRESVLFCASAFGQHTELQTSMPASNQLLSSGKRVRA